MAKEKSPEIETAQQPVPDNLLDLDKIIENKSPLLKKLLPGFLLNYVKQKMVHQDLMNYYLTTYGHFTGVDFIDGVLGDMSVTLDMVGLENIPDEGKCIIAANHPLGGIDGMALMLVVSKVRRDIVFPVNDLLMNIKNLQELFIPINKLGSNAENIKIINDTFASDKVVCYFPFGLVSRKKRGEIKDIEWKTTFLTKARRFKRDVIPTHISGRNTNFFYNLANFRKRIGLKFNIEMLYLPNELSKQQNSTLTFTFGSKIPYSFFDKRFPMQDWAELMRKYCYKLGDGYAESFEQWIEEK